MQSLETHLAILQQSEYEYPRYLDWVKRHRNKTIHVEPKQWTPKLRLLQWLSIFIALCIGKENAIRWSLFVISFPEAIVKTILVNMAITKLRTLQSTGLQVVAIAGSYAKTSTKQVIAQLLSPSISLLSTPESVNTKLGIALVILNKLQPTHKIFLVELGAYMKGEIADLVRFVRPSYAILTPIGIEHLERFGSLENIIATETELFTTLPVKMISHDANIQVLPETLRNNPKLSYYGFFPNSRFDISNIELTTSGTQCRLEIDEKEYNLFVPLFGKHNLVNILPTFWLAEQLHISTETILKRLPHVKPVKHRLEPIQLESGALMLDNGYNTNPSSVKEAIKVLQDIPAKNRIVVTPGFVELGEKQPMYNERLGEALASAANIVCITGSTNIDALRKGLLSKKFKTDNILSAENENDALQKLHPYLKPETVVLFEGGTPEVYQ